MQTIDLKVNLREGRGKGVARKIRAAGGVPAVVYGVGVEPTAIEVPASESRKFNAAIGHNVFVKLDVDGPLSGKMSLINEYQREAIRGHLLHADLLVVDMSKSITVEVSVLLIGTAIGQKEGGIVNMTRREIEVRCLPTAIPENIEIDITELNINDSIHIEDLKLPEGVEAVADTNFTLVTVNAPAAEEEVKVDEEAIEGEEGAEGEAAPGAEGADGAPAAGDAPAGGGASN